MAENNFRHVRFMWIKNAAGNYIQYTVRGGVAPRTGFEPAAYRLGVLPSLSLLISKHLKLVENVTKNELILPYLCP